VQRGVLALQPLEEPRSAPRAVRHFTCEVDQHGQRDRGQGEQVPERAPAADANPDLRHAQDEQADEEHDRHDVGDGSPHRVEHELVLRQPAFELRRLIRDALSNAIDPLLVVQRNRRADRVPSGVIALGNRPANLQSPRV
jgi:hypothetical protein